jgi:hypothetical protein
MAAFNPAARQMRNFALQQAAIGFLIFFAGCSKRAEEPLPGPTTGTSSSAGKQGTGASTQISAAEKLLKSGEMDKAAAQLMQAQVMAPAFSPKEALQYRQTMQEIYEASLEAARRGDPKAQAALQLLRATAPR